MILFFVLFILLSSCFFQKVCACDSSKSSNPVFPLHPKQFKQLEKESKCAFKKYIYVYIQKWKYLQESKMEQLSLYSL